MDRFAVFVDAGYLLAEGGKLCCGSWKRSDLTIDPREASRVIEDRANKRCDVPLLRIYWYDGARGGNPTGLHSEIAALPNVKLRLGRTDARGKQKGVDALIYRDLMTLARERAISDAFLLAGDEDLREGVKAAQDVGVRVNLVGVDSTQGGRNQSRELVNEADELLILTKEDISPFIECSPAVGQLSGKDSHPKLSGQRVDTGGETNDEDEISRNDLMPVAQVAASGFAAQWLSTASEDDIELLLGAEHSIPQPIENQLRAAVEKEIGGSWDEHERLRRAARGAFGLRVQQWASSRGEDEN